MTVTHKQDTLPSDKALHLYKEGVAQLTQGKTSSAHESLTQAVALDNTLAPAHYQLGNCQRLMGEDTAAEASLRQAIALDRELHDAYFSLAFLLRNQGRVSDIEPLLTAMAEAISEDAEHIEQAAGLLAEYGRNQAALKLFERAQQLRPELARLHVRIGQMLMGLGEFSRANEAFLHAIQCDPQSGPAYLMLAHSSKAEAMDDQRIGICKTRLEDAQLPANTRICLHFALGKLLDDTREYSPAFEHYLSGNRMHRRQIRYDRLQWEQFVDTQCQMPALQATLAKQTAPTPVFVVGMLRSGTTLVDRMLSNHSAVYALGETEMLDRLAESLSQHAGVPYPLCLRRLTAEHLEMLAQEYRSRWPREASKARYIVDKNPINFMYIGLIAQLFPEARFIHCTRDPRDTALSIYFQHFAHTRNAYAYDLGDIGHFYLGYRKLMLYWQSMYANTIHQIEYEAMVGDAETGMHKLLDFLSLNWEPGCANTQASDKTISTASVWQARQPIYSDSVGRWRNYSEYLTPFMRILPDSERALLTG
ncbi:MAG: sulfotransferase [Gammaproteobacteria bacterium]|nr:sulfotransferase [Gammaproteobacteria bacterium]MDE2345481.1 sulfotransferase [Gammaproteobacteria bacterium]